uniref:Uncharacterized protein n=1 Tax=Anguilla anguilla TaxID=7936 RepID=A0A0E9XIS8_ANGAN
MPNSHSFSAAIMLTKSKGASYVVSAYLFFEAYK